MKIFLQNIIFSSTGAHLRDKTRIYVGAAISPDHFATDSDYKRIAAEELNCVTPPNQLKWGWVETSKGHTNYDLPELLMKFAKEHNMKVRGHTLIWHQSTPKWVEALSNNTVELEKAMVKHIT